MRLEEIPPNGFHWTSAWKLLARAGLSIGRQVANSGPEDLYLVTYPAATSEPGGPYSS